MDRGAWQAIVHWVTKSWTQLKQFSTHWSLNLGICETKSSFNGLVWLHFENTQKHNAFLFYRDFFLQFVALVWFWVCLFFFSLFPRCLAIFFFFSVSLSFSVCLCLSFHVPAAATYKESSKERLIELQAEESSLYSSMSRMCLHPGLTLWTFSCEFRDSEHMKANP